MPAYRKSGGKAVEHKPTKYDGFKLVQTEVPYRHQKGSGRSECFEVAKNGMLIGTWTKACAALGHDSKFVVGSLIKLAGTATPGWKFSDKNSEGLTLEDIKKVRQSDPAKEALKAEKAKASAEKKEAAAKVKEDAKAKKEADKALAKEKADKKNADAKAKAEAKK